MKKSALLKLINFWPPFIGTGIRVKSISKDFTDITVELKLRFWNKNYVGTQFGGSIYAMTDPFYMLILMENLGRDYIVWDKAANIRFLKPGRGKLTARFYLTPEQIADVRHQADNNYKTEPMYLVEVKDEHGEIVAEVEKILYVRHKDKKPWENVHD